MREDSPQVESQITASVHTVIMARLSGLPIDLALDQSLRRTLASARRRICASTRALFSCTIQRASGSQ